MPGRRPLAAAVGLALTTPLLLLAPPASAAALVVKPYDFNGDGFPEQVVGAPNLQVGAVKGAGGVFVLPGSKKGLSTAGQTLTQATAGVAGDPAAGGRFGGAFASADFDGDGYADLAIGAPADGAESGADDDGTVTVLLGSSTGLTGVRSYVVTRAGRGDADGFGSSLVTADFDRDGAVDLAVGAPYADIAVLDDEDYVADGSVTVLRGGGSTFSTGRSRVLQGVRTGPTYDLRFGSSLAVGDVDGDSAPDLVVASEGLAFEDGDGHEGYVSVCPAGARCGQIRSKFGFPGLESLAVGNVSGSARPEIVLGLVPDPHEEDEEGGSVWTLSLSGTGPGLTATAKELDQDTLGVPGSNEVRDAFGSSVALGDLDGDGYDDLVVGAAGEAIGSRKEAGRVTVVHGGKKGYRTSGNTSYDQNTRGVPGTAEAGDGFGAAVTLLDHDADGHLDLTVGAPGENGSGAITTLDGSGTRFTAKGSKTFGLGTLADPTPDDAAFGAVLGG